MFDFIKKLFGKKNKKTNANTANPIAGIIINPPAPAARPNPPTLVPIVNSSSVSIPAPVTNVSTGTPTLHVSKPMKANIPGQPNVGTNELSVGALNVGSNSGSSFISTKQGHIEVRDHPDNQGLYVRIKAATPIHYNDLSTKAYVDAIASGYSIQDTCIAATNGSNTNLPQGAENGDGMDGLIIFSGQLILIKDQTDPTENGVYVVNLSGMPTRYPASGMLSDNIFYIEQGRANHETFWKVVGTFTGSGGQPNYGVDAINFVPVTLHPTGGGGSVNISGTSPINVNNPSAGSYQISLDSSGVTPGTYNTLTVDANGIVTFGTNVSYTGSGTVTQIDTGTGLTGGPITGNGTISMLPTGVIAGTYGNGSSIAQITVNALGQITNASNISVPPSFTWNNVSGTTQLMVANNGYITSNPALTILPLPTTVPQGAVIAVAGANIGGWKITQNAGQTIHFGNQNSTTGTAGILESTHQYDYVELLCIIANTDFMVKASVGDLSIL